MLEKARRAAKVKAEEEACEAVKVKAAVYSNPAFNSFVFFLSHMQSNSQDQCLVLSLELTFAVVPHWLDVNAKSGGINQSGMLAAVDAALYFLLFLNDKTLARPWVQLEVRFF